MITPTRSVFIGFLFGLLGVAAGGLFVTWIMARTVTTADMLPLVFVFVLCGASGALKSEQADIERQRRSDRLTEDERRARLAPVVVAMPSVDDTAAEDEWYTHTLRPLFTNGHRAGGFSWTALARTMIQDDWERLCKFYCGLEGRRVMRLEPGNVGYVLNTPTWTHADVMREIAAHTLPHPEGMAPDVATLTDDAARRDARRGQNGGVGEYESA